MELPNVMVEYLMSLLGGNERINDYVNGLRITCTFKRIDCRPRIY